MHHRQPAQDQSPTTPREIGKKNTTLHKSAPVRPPLWRDPQAPWRKEEELGVPTKFYPSTQIMFPQHDNNSRSYTPSRAKRSGPNYRPYWWPNAVKWVTNKLDTVNNARKTVFFPHHATAPHNHLPMVKSPTNAKKNNRSTCRRMERPYSSPEGPGKCQESGTSVDFPPKRTKLKREILKCSRRTYCRDPGP